MPNSFLGTVTAIPYPGRLIIMGEKDKQIVTAVQQRLNKIGCGPLKEDGDFGLKTQAAVKLFQGRFPDHNGNPLIVDGKIGAISWSVLFGKSSVGETTKAATPYMKGVIDFATSQIGQLEKPLGSNRGPMVDKYLKAVGLNPASGSYAWCVAFTHYCYMAAANAMGRTNPHIMTAGVLDHWAKAATKAGVVRITSQKAIADPTLVQPGSLFIMDFGGGLGHSGLVTAVSGGFLTTIEGNTNDDGSRNGIGVFKRTTRKINSINKGFIDYSGV